MGTLKALGSRLADSIASFIGSWTFIIIQSTVLTIWVIINATNLVHFDPYPFILMNLFLSFQAAYATPMILMSSSMQTARDRKHLKLDLDVDRDTNTVIKGMSKALDKIDQDIQLDRQAIKDHLVLKEELVSLKEDIKKLHKKLDRIQKP